MGIFKIFVDLRARIHVGAREERAHSAETAIANGLAEFAWGSVAGQPAARTSASPGIYAPARLRQSRLEIR